MVRKKTFGILGLMAVFALGATLLPRPAAAQNSKDALQQIFALLSSLGDVTKSWSAALPAQERFVVLGAFNNEAVLDKNTGLVWERSVVRTPRRWASALYACYSATTGGQMGWRMPSISELTSLVDPGVTHPALPAGSPFELNGHAFFWSATRRVNFTDLVWGYNIREGILDDYETDLAVSVLCVRGAASPDPH